MDINGNLKTPCNIYGICGYKQSGKNTVAKIWQLLDFYYKMGKDYWVKYAAINGKIKEFTDDNTWKSDSIRKRHKVIIEFALKKWSFSELNLENLD